jgi:hypothetical protein
MCHVMSLILCLCRVVSLVLVSKVNEVLVHVNKFVSERVKIMYHKC